MIEHALHDRLAIVERAVDGDGADIGGVGRRHHPPLHVGNAALREQHDEVDLGATAERLDRGAAGIARGRHHDGPAFAARGQHVIHQPRQELHRQVLERQRRAVEQLEHESVGAELAQRRDRGMAELAVGLARHAGEIGFGDRVAGERPDHLDGDLGVGPAGEARDRLRLEPRPGLRHIEAAVAGETREHHVGEAEGGGLAPGGDVTHSQQLPAPPAAVPPRRQ